MCSNRAGVYNAVLNYLLVALARHRQYYRNKEMNPATAVALTLTLVWSDMPDVILVREQHADLNCRSRLELQNHVKEQIREKI